MRVVNKSVCILCCFVAWSISMTSHAAPKSKMIEFWNDYEPSSGLKLDHSKWQFMLDRYLDTQHSSGVSRFKYDQVTDADRKVLDEYLTYLQSMDPRQLNFPRKKAFWLNLYNAGVVSMVLNSEPEESIRDIGNVWRKKSFTVSWQKVSLDDIEHGILRPLYNDPRIHFGLTPATIGSGDLPAKAYTGDNVEELLERNTLDFFTGSNKGFYIDGKKLVVSRIFRWYKSDFGRNSDDIKSFIKKYLDAETQAKVDQTSGLSYQYNWELNKP